MKRCLDSFKIPRIITKNSKLRDAISMFVINQDRNSQSTNQFPEAPNTTHIRRIPVSTEDKMRIMKNL